MNAAVQISPPCPAVTLLTAAFLLICVWHFQSAVGAISNNTETYQHSLSRPISGPHSLVHEFTARSFSLQKLYIFADREHLQRYRDNIIVVELVDATNLEVISRLESRLAPATFVHGDCLVFTPRWVVQKGKTYWLRFSLPDAAQDDGLSFVISPPLEAGSDLLRIDGELQDGMVLNHFFLGSRVKFPIGLVAAGVLLAGLSVALHHAAGRWPLILVTAGTAMTLSEYRWEQLLWMFWGWYWPDGYPLIAHQIFGALSGTSSLRELLNFLSSHRNGGNFLVPLLMALLHRLGIPYIFGYALVSFAFSVGSLLVLEISLAKHWRLQSDQRAFLILLTGLHLQVIDCVARPLTDAGGMFFTVLFVAAFTDYAKAPRGTDKSLWIAASAACLGILTRLALLPLLLVPIAFVFWRCLLSRPCGGFFQLVRPAAVSLVAAILVGATYTSLQLWGSVSAAGAFAAREEFTSAFSLATYAKNTVLATQLALPLGLLRLRDVLNDERQAIPLLTVLGFQGMLLVGRIIPWSRYWAPVAPLACGMACVLLFDGRQLTRRWQFAILGLSVAGNLAYLAINPGY